MSNIKIIDASVAIKWFVTEEKGRDKALSILDDIRSSPHLFAVPELFWNEMLAVFCKLETNATSIKRHLYLLENLGFHRLGNGHELLSTAAQMAIDHHLSGYDALYAACAKVMDGIWITADIRAHKRIERLGVSRGLYE